VERRERKRRGVFQIALLIVAAASPTVFGQQEAAPDPPPVEPSAAQAPPDRQKRVIEEIVVTAQRKEQAEIDVPISMSVLDDQFLKQQGIKDLRDVSLYVPNVNIRTSAVFPDFRIRGFGSSPVNAAFEQSVGLNIDGVPYTRKAYFQAGLFDIGRVEILRGPQGTLFGKNTTAGLLNIVTQDPTDEVTGVLDFQGGSYDFRRFEAAAGGPLIKGFVNLRIAGLLDERDGYLENTTAKVAPDAPKSLLGYDRKGLRVKLDLPNLLGSDLKLTYELARLDLVGGSEFRRIPQTTRSFYRQYDPGTDFEPDNLKGSIDHPDGSRNKINSFVANWRAERAGWGLDLIGGYSLLHDVIDNDSDFSPAPAAFTVSSRDEPQATAEVLLSSPTLTGLLGLGSMFGRNLGTSNITLGVFYQRRQFKHFTESLHLNDPVVLEFSVAQDLPPQVPLDSLPPLGNPEATRESSTVLFEETADAIAGFGQLEWQFLERWTLQYGMRLTNETKDAAISRVFDTANHVIISEVLGWEAFARELSRSELQFTPKVSLGYKPTDDVGLFVSWGRGVKGGGFNDFASGGTDAELEFNPEKVSQWEIDMKTRLLDGAATFNLALFRMDVTDFQVITQEPPDVTVKVENAAKARSQGVEADLNWLPTDWLTVRDAAGFVDARFLKFPIGTCPQDMTNTDGDSDPRCDLSGRPFPFTPKWTNTLTTDVLFPVAGVPGLKSALPSALRRLALTSGLAWEFHGQQYLLDDLDPRKRQGWFFRLRGSVGIGDLSRGWSLRFTVENLTDERTAVLVNEITTGPGHFVQYPDPPRLFVGQLRYQF
jgi:iron complex outermembrane recepter protein